jgi:hypothetical protein
MQRVFQTYYQRWRFRHPTTRDFIAIVEEVSGRNLDWFFEPYVYGTAVVDYAVDSIENTPADGGTDFHSTVVLRRLKDGVFPQSILVRFDDGTSETSTWDGALETHELRFTGRSPVEEVTIDPDHLVWLDVDRLNNSRRTTPDTRYARRVQFRATVWLQQWLYILAGLF